MDSVGTKHVVCDAPRVKALTCESTNAALCECVVKAQEFLHLPVQWIKAIQKVLADVEDVVRVSDVEIFTLCSACS